jgi:putative ABC transport system permease protein
MSWASVVAARVRGLFHRDELERRLDDEVRFHLQRQAEDNVQAGMNPTDARYAALRSFGAVDPVKERYRERMSLALIETMMQDLRYAARTLRRSSGFTIASVATLALAIGVTTAMFSVVNAVLLRPLPYTAPEQLAVLWTENPSQNIREARSAYSRVQYWREHSKTFADIAVFDPASVTLTTPTDAQQISAASVSPNFFRLLGVSPVLGRAFSTDDGYDVVLISHDLWQTRYGASLDVIGAAIELNGRSARIIGVIPQGFRLAGLAPAVWMTFSGYGDPSQPWNVVGRLRPGVTIEQAQAEMTSIARGLDEQLPVTERNRGISVVSLSEYVVGSKSRVALWMLTGGVLCVLLIALVNVASLSLARGVGRAREIAVRAALGASSIRITRQLLAEGLTVAALACAVGCLFALVLIPAIRVLSPGDLARINEVSLDSRVLVWTLGIAVLTGIVVGFTPAFTLLRRNLSGLTAGGRMVAGGTATARIRSALVVAEFALAIVLLAGAGLLLRSWWQVDSINPGFRPQRVLSLRFSTPATLANAQRGHFYDRVLDEVKVLPAVEAAGLINDWVISSASERTVAVEGRGTIPERIRVARDEVSPGIFETIRTPLLKGRLFSTGDGPHSPRVSIISESMARALWPAQDPLGQRFKLGAAEASGPWFTVVGVIADMRRQGLERVPIPQMFVPLAQGPTRTATLMVRTSSRDPLTMADAVQAAIRGVDKHAPIYQVTTLEEVLERSVADRRFQTSLLSAFSLAALLMAAIGIYGLIQYSVATRTREIGVRMAIGAKAGDILGMVIREGLKLSLAGLTLGFLGALWIGRAGSSLLYGVTATDPLTFIGVALLLTAVAAAACYFPARRATKVAPVSALREP